MNTPICDFVKKYCESNAVRFHMPGHKGLSLLGMENIDITEITGADSLYEANGIISESENNASKIFGTGKTLYSAEGSSLSIRAMVYLIKYYAKKEGKKELILSNRNAHKTFISATALTDIDVEYIKSVKNGTYISCSEFDYPSLEKEIENLKPCALYITSPDYLGNIADIKKLSEICKKHNILLAVDNAHGAYLKFLPLSVHPIDSGADICCDSAHKTLPALTGAGYLHLRKNLPGYFYEKAKYAMALFGSTSPSYLILQSLDACNGYIVDKYCDKLKDFIIFAENEKKKLIAKGYHFIGNEKMKWTFETKKIGYRGYEFQKELEKRNIICEFADNDYTVLMFSCENGREAIKELLKVLSDIPIKKPIESEKIPDLYIPEKVLEPSQAVFEPSETVKVENAEGRILAAVNVSCPPAIPVAVCGERIDKEVIKRFNYYHIKTCEVLK